MYFVPELGMLALIAILTVLPKKKEREDKGKDKQR